LTDIHWKNVKDNLCIVCKISLGSPSYYICKKCNKICKIIWNAVSAQIMDVKSVCCKADIESHQKITCGDSCHEKFIIKMLQEHGLFKKVIDMDSGIAYKIPTRLIIEEGLRQEELKNYPTW